MTSKITLYRTELTPERNAIIDDIADYLNIKAHKVYEADNVMYQKIALNMNLNLAAAQEKVGDQSLGNYAVITQDNKNFYFFITSAEWTSKGAVTIGLSLDTLNTFSDALEFTDKTTIQRQHGTRLALYLNEDTKPGYKNLYRIINKVPEDIVMTKTQTYSKKLLEQEDLNWFLIYKTRDGLTPENLGNPVKCSLIADKKLPVLYKGSTLNTRIFTPSSFGTGTYYYLLFSENVDASVEIEDLQTNLKKDETEPDKTYATTLNKDLEFVLSNAKTSVLDGSFDKLAAPLKALIIHAEGDRIYVNCDGDNVSEINTRNKKSAAFEFNCKSLTITALGQLRYSTDLYGYESIPKIPNILYYGKDSQKVYTNSINDLNKTDNKLIKIIRLPYAPVEVTKTSDGLYQFPEEWYFDEGVMTLNVNNLSTEFENKIATIDLKPKLTLEHKYVTPDSKRWLLTESKMYNSEFYTLKYTYDSFVKDIKLENYTFEPDYEGENLSLPINFKPTNTINSKFAFSFDTSYNPDLTYDKESDYEDYLLVSRNNEETIFNNAYINYINTGYNYDKKAKDVALAQGLFSTFTGLGQTALTTGVGVAQSNKEFRAEHGNPVNLFGKEFALKNSAISPFLSAAAISAGFNTINGLTSTIVGQVQAQDSIDRKLKELSNQSTNVSGADDVDLLQYYSGNKLTEFTYELKPLAKSNIRNLFYYTGYACPVQEIPNINSRYWFNYLKCTPVFKNEFTSVYSDYLIDIKTRFEQGVTIYHHHPEIEREWDFEQTRENWETEILDTSYLPIDKYTYLGIKNVVKTGNTFTFELEPGYEIDGITSSLTFIYTHPNGRQMTVKVTDPDARTFTVGSMKANSLRVVKNNLMNSRLSSDVTPLTYTEGE